MFLQRVFSIDTIVKPLPPAMAYNISRNLNFFTRIFTQFFAAQGKILTIDNLRKRGMVVMEWCYLCKKSRESIDHLLLHCEVAGELWAGILSRTGLNWVMPRSVEELLARWNRPRNSAQLAAVWRMMPLCLMSRLWSERNESCFNDKERGVGEIWNFFVFSLFQWFSAIVLKGGMFMSFYFLYSPLECN
ncbi:uncharacterized protein LOC122307595 isoform X2 [Carya illinoinensis]|uniref:uncharacterized protein LOC122307595 isoform X2 n=1 Tax=Carya illinoinensis TaxID=32201 RepID=UPI001C720238|nr:uncharacterized protein LOC122307595 isoform X2 [Carya illinoinensis]